MPIVFADCADTCPPPIVTQFTPQECVASLPTTLSGLGATGTLQLATPAPASGQTVTVQIGLTASATFVFPPGMASAVAPIVGVLPAPLPATAFFVVLPLVAGCGETSGQVAIT